LALDLRYSVAWPQPVDYKEVIQDPRQCFLDPELRGGWAVESARGSPRAYPGNFSEVYQIRGADGRAWAVKCFTREVDSLEARYQALADHLRQASPAFIVRFDFLRDGIRVRGRWYPIVKMDWVEGVTLSDFVRLHADKPAVMERLAKKWVKLSLQLRQAKMAHGDFQHANVLLEPGEKATHLSLRLIDYDGMFVPALAASKSAETGHPNYRHPRRINEGVYNAEIDRFPHLVIYTALRALTVGGRELFEKYDNGENLLFREQDFVDPRESPLLLDLWKLPDPELRRLIGHLVLGAQLPAEEVVLLEDLVGSEGRPLGLTVGQEHHVLSLLPPAAARIKAPAAIVSPQSLEEIVAEGDVLQTGPFAGGQAVAESVAATRAVTQVRAATSLRPASEPAEATSSSVLLETKIVMPGFLVPCGHCRQWKHVLLAHCPYCRKRDWRLFAVCVVVTAVGMLVARVALPLNQPGLIGIGGLLAVLGPTIGLPLATALGVLLIRGWRDPLAEAPQGPAWPAVHDVCRDCGKTNFLLIFLCRHCGAVRWERLAAVAALALFLAVVAAGSHPHPSASQWWTELTALYRWAIRLGGGFVAFVLLIGSVEIWRSQTRLSAKERIRTRAGRIALGLALVLPLFCFGLLLLSLFSVGPR
jgi:hypothetical protein